VKKGRKKEGVSNKMPTSTGVSFFKIPSKYWRENQLGNMPPSYTKKIRTGFYTFKT
jgi:hypothetical protein